MTQAANDGLGSSSGSLPHDGRLNDLADALRNLYATGAAQKTFLTNPTRAFSRESLAPHHLGYLGTGLVLFAMPYTHWYKVAMVGMGGTIACCAGQHDSFLPTGVRGYGPLPAYSQVVVWVPPGGVTGIILGAYPGLQQDGRRPTGDVVSQGGGSGIRREGAYNFLPQMYDKAGVTDHSAGRPLDGTGQEWGKLTETGLEIHLDPFLGFMRVNEMCGVWFNYWDSCTRLAGVNLDIHSAVHEITARADEGENRYVHGDSTYPWEAAGLCTYDPALPLHAAFDPEAVQTTLFKGVWDLADAQEDVQSICRYQEFGGYLGQGRRRQVMVPANTGQPVKRQFADQKPDFGVFAESIGLDGTYVLGTAKQLFIGKRALLPVAREKRLPEDQKQGDDFRKNNYSFSGKFPGGKPHKIGDVTVPANANRHLLQVAGILDLVTHAFNWRGLHPFSYHEEDYDLVQETELGSVYGFSAAEDHLDFGELSGQMNMRFPEVRQLTVDHRYGPVNYYQRASGWSVLPDGTQVREDGYGVRETLSAGSYRVDAPGDIILAPGRNLVILGGHDIILRAHDSVDVTAANHDVRFKAERNLHMLGGNKAAGGVLIESKAAGWTADFPAAGGEDITLKGIVFKAANSSIAAYAQATYLAGQTLTLDADRGNGTIALHAQSVDAFCGSRLGIYLGGGDNAFSEAYVFDTGGARLSGQLAVGGGVTAGGGALFNGTVRSFTGFSAVSGYPDIGQDDLTSFRDAVTALEATVAASIETGDAAYALRFVAGAYADGQIGHAETIAKIQFSFRDDAAHAQYRTADFRLWESRWQELVRLGLATGGTAWTEPTVQYGNAQQLPWPGYSKWAVESTLDRLKELTMFKDGYSQDRPGPYETATLANSDPAKPAVGFLVIG